MARQLIICCDGTNNNLTGRTNDTNVTQLCELLTPVLNNQLLYYDPGVGNPGQLPGASWGDSISRSYERLHGLVFGKGIYENIAECYRFLMRNWLPGDEIFMFGFSRGAFTARSVGGLVTQFGILRPDMDVMLPTLLHLYFSDRKDDETAYVRIRDQIRDMYTDELARDAPVWFMGVWDTVASVGSPLFSRKITASPTIVGKNFRHVRQALALDEYRRNFLPRPYVIEKGYNYAAKGQSIEQKWFSGAHCDVGGGYANAEAGLSAQTLAWMLDAAGNCGLRFRKEVLIPDTYRLDLVRLQPWLAGVSGLKVSRAKRAHAETHSSPLWALGGQLVRNPEDRGGFKKKVVICPPDESPTVASNKLAVPADTVWRIRRLLVSPRSVRLKPGQTAFNPLNYQLFKVMLAAVFLFLLWTLHGALLLGPDMVKGGSFWSQFCSALHMQSEIAHASLAYACWQLGWVGQWLVLCDLATTSMPVAVYPASATLTDFGLVAAYGYLLAFGVSWAFAWIAGLRRVNMMRGFKVKALNLLGRAATFAVVGDVFENIFNLALLGIPPDGYFPLVEFALGACMSIASLAKWSGLAGSVLLMTWGVAARFIPALRADR